MAVTMANRSLGFTQRAAGSALSTELDLFAENLQERTFS